MQKDVINSTQDITRLSWRSEIIDANYTKRYHWGISLLFKISQVARLLLDFLGEEMDQDNIVANSPQLKNDFNAILINAKKKNTPITPSIKPLVNWSIPTF